MKKYSLSNDVLVMAPYFSFLKQEVLIVNIDTDILKTLNEGSV